MERKHLEMYTAPQLRLLAVSLERGFAVSGDFEQPEFGGEDNL